MPKGGSYNPSPDSDGKWFSHRGLPAIPLKRHTATSTGSMLNQVTTAIPCVQGVRFPKTFIQQEGKTSGREYPFSVHDNRLALQDTMYVCDSGLGRRKANWEKRQHTSHIACLWAPGALGREDDCTCYQTDYLGCQDTESPVYRRYPRSHTRGSSCSAAPAGNDYLWFGRHSTKQQAPLHVPVNIQFPWIYSCYTKSISTKYE
ncbi:TEX36 protein, partial [Polyodon spathula]|nr:testis-expressed protein 36 isoform X2 [Polyodon spathula]XP_041116801.1 testis-expressed protein 36 isoform X2 [Polyodon spathula]MBN3276011.1 TEX36 protein [Polyodon spathula]